MEAQPLAQAELPEQAVIRDLVPFDQLRARAELGVHAIKRVIDHEAMVADDVAAGRHRIHGAEIGMRDEARRPPPP
jgi:hypothetical protein